MIAFWINGRGVRTDGHNVRVAIQMAFLKLKPTGIRFIIRIHHSDQITARQLKSSVPGCHHPTIWRLVQPNAIVAPGVCLYGFRRAIGGPIVDDHEFKISECLIENTPYGRGDEPLRIVDRHDDRDADHHCTTISHDEEHAGSCRQRRSRSKRAGFPPTMAKDGTFFTTTAPAAITEPWPMRVTRWHNSSAPSDPHIIFNDERNEFVESLAGSSEYHCA